MNAEGVFIRKGNITISHPAPTGASLEWNGSEFFLAPLSYSYVDVLDWLAIGDNETITLGGKVYTAQTNVANVDYSTGNFLVEAPKPTFSASTSTIFLPG